MKNFQYYAPTQVVFGRDTENQTPALIKRYGGKKVLLHYGGQSAERSGLLQKVEQMLLDAGIEYIKLGGVKPNPRLSLVRKGIELCKEEGVDFLLAVGGGSVIDSCKAISSGRFYDGDVWTLYEHKDRASRYLPIGCILTIPAAGSEMSNGSVITNDEVDGWLKKDYGAEEFRLKFAIMNPEYTFTLPAWQTACGITDMMIDINCFYSILKKPLSSADSVGSCINQNIYFRFKSRKRRINIFNSFKLKRNVRT